MPQSDSATLDLFENYQDYLAAAPVPGRSEAAANEI